MLNERKQTVSTLRQRYDSGVESLEKTTAEVKRMEIELTALQPVLVEKTAAADKMEITISHDRFCFSFAVFYCVFTNCVFNPL